jgi:hypothetical protein
MSDTATIQGIYEELKELKKDITFIKKHMFDPDTIMTTDEARRFEQSMRELDAKETTPLSSVKKKLGL